ncbi:hypothetical protein CVT25_011721 [Psilocybe cyanescens]|uniref:Uncharacterized protein n=1 Tax=Psilocybe cyanescens TaxID=93625 RepID=A0A409WID2_PSICY|nr:hypothetical protein CVT25_011721 [Psilocybe cyanescens]
MFNRAMTTFTVLAAVCAAACIPVSDSEVVARGAVRTQSSIVPATIEVAPTVSLCTGQQNCFTIPFVSYSCVSFTGGLSFLASEVSSATIPGGFVCTFAANTKCEPQGEYVVLPGGKWNFSEVPGPNGNFNFNKRAESFICSPI